MVVLSIYYYTPCVSLLRSEMRQESRLEWTLLPSLIRPLQFAQPRTVCSLLPDRELYIKEREWIHSLRQ
jgi:hypothetical protein